jgi:hypothetical protein
MRMASPRAANRSSPTRPSAATSFSARARRGSSSTSQS